VLAGYTAGEVRTPERPPPAPPAPPRQWSPRLPTPLDAAPLDSGHSDSERKRKWDAVPDADAPSGKRPKVAGPSEHVDHVAGAPAIASLPLTVVELEPTTALVSRDVLEQIAEGADASFNGVGAEGADPTAVQPGLPPMAEAVPDPLLDSDVLTYPSPSSPSSPAGADSRTALPAASVSIDEAGPTDSSPPSSPILPLAPAETT
jgi:hypothetical protein